VYAGQHTLSMRILLCSLRVRVAASMRLCMGSRRGFIIRMKIGSLTSASMDSVSSASHCMRVRQRSTLGPSADGQQYAVVHVTGYIKNWPPAGLCHVIMREVTKLSIAIHGSQSQSYETAQNTTHPAQ